MPDPVKKQNRKRKPTRPRRPGGVPQKKKIKKGKPLPPPKPQRSTGGVTQKNKKIIKTGSRVGKIMRAGSQMSQAQLRQAALNKAKKKGVKKPMKPKKKSTGIRKKMY